MEGRGHSILVAVAKYIDLTAYRDENDDDENDDDENDADENDNDENDDDENDDDENDDNSFTDDDSILHVNIDKFGNEYISI